MEKSNQTQIQVVPTTETKSSRVKKCASVTLFVTMAVQVFISTFVETMIIPAFPVMSQDFGKDGKWLPWAITAYLLLGSVMIPILSGLSRVTSRRFVASLSVVISSIGFFVAAAAGKTSIAVFIVARALQGFAFPSIAIWLDVVNTDYPAKMIPLLMSVIIAMISVGTALGLVCGALIVMALEWNYSFYVIGAPYTVVALILCILVGEPKALDKEAHGDAEMERKAEIDEREEKGEREDGKEEKQKNENTVPNPKRTAIEKIKSIDFAGAIMLSVGTLCLLIGISYGSYESWKSPVTITLMCISPVFFVAFVVWDLWISAPLLPLKLMRNPTQAMMNLASFFVGALMLGFMVVIPYMLTTPSLPFGYTKQITVGLVMLPFGVTAFISPVAAKIQEKFKIPWCVNVSLGVCLVGSAVFVKVHDTLAAVIVLETVIGFAINSSIVFMNNLIMTTCTKDEFAAANGLHMFFRTIGAAISPVILAACMSLKAQEVVTTSAVYIEYADYGFIIAYSVILICAVLAFGFSLFITPEMSLYWYTKRVFSRIVSVFRGSASTEQTDATL